VSVFPDFPQLTKPPNLVTYEIGDYSKTDTLPSPFFFLPLVFRAFFSLVVNPAPFFFLPISFSIFSFREAFFQSLKRKIAIFPPFF